MADDVQPNLDVRDALLDQLEHGTLHRFADYATLTGVIPGSGAGVYTIWDDDGGLVYAGIAGRNPEGRGLASRLRDRRHAAGRASIRVSTSAARRPLSAVLCPPRGALGRPPELSVLALMRVGGGWRIQKRR